MKEFAITLLMISCLFLAHEARCDLVWQNIQLNSDTTLQLQNEEQIAINPTNPDNMVAVWRDFRLGYRQVGWGYTFDGGATWTDGGLFVEPNYEWQSDPGVTTDKHGNFYAVVLSSAGTWVNGLYVFESTDGGVSWGPPLEVVNGFPDAFEDKEFMACDRTDSPHAGNLYVVWNRFLNNDPDYPTNIVVRRSTDAGQSWSETVPVSDTIDVHYPIPVVGREGELYVAWTSYESSIKIDVSMDGGVTFAADSTVVEVFTEERLINGGILAYSSPHMDADITDGPFSGRLYVSFMDQRDGLIDCDIWVTWSDDTCKAWSVPVRINDDAENNGRDQFHPWLMVDNTGVVTVVFLDRREDPDNLLYHCYLTQSADGGSTWSTNVQISTEPSNPTLASPGLPRALEEASFGRDNADTRTPQISVLAGLLGEYIGVTAWNGVPTPVWTDIRNGHQDVFAGHLVDTDPVLIQRFAAKAFRKVVHLEWDLSADEAVAGFNIYRQQGRNEDERVVNRDGLIPEADRCYDDTDFEPGKSYYYTLGVVKADGGEVRSPTIEVETISIEFSLGRIHPNPFNVTTTITYAIHKSGTVNLRIYDTQGRLINTLVSRQNRAGEHTASWNGMNKMGSLVAPGIYFVRLQSGSRVQTKKIVFLK